ncbi:tripartite tricarboxylate transporter substrate binding protein [Achromobacter sp. GG226]|uniref:Bug family tripartite tricarboxylate transporter substrate binding protein n=1 Tax=Verticiella alkaliphila TaxID=2779529 RepID=UPI001C0DCFF1|nr:tripartite tricarboxylate transporter substrate binding protein [Verticiella sp. GG226]MBU4609663.1 tripartite tricarboxylate transporter substrate binding protein [Verticiella sp. GG226]
MTRSSWALAVGAFGLAMCGVAAAQTAANYPTRPVTIIVRYAPGNVTDVLARFVAEGLSREWGQPVTVENRPGMGGSMGAALARRAPADGYTLLFSAMAAMAINPHVYSNVGYDALTDFAPLVSVAYPQGVLAVSATVPVKTFPELLAYSKANPGELNYASLGNGTVPHLNFELLKAASGLKAEHVPYKASSAAATDMVGGRVHLQQESTSVLLPLVREGRAVALFTSSDKRLADLPDVPTAAEVAPGFTPLRPWLGLFALKGTPEDIQAKLETDILKVLNTPQFDERLKLAGMVELGEGRDAFRKTIEADYNRLGDLVKQLGVKVD